MRRRLVVDRESGRVGKSFSLWTNILLTAFLVSQSLYLAPGLRSAPDVPEHFQAYYQLSAARDAAADQYYAEHVAPFLRHSLKPESAKSAPGMFSGNEHVSLTCTLLYFSSGTTTETWLINAETWLFALAGPVLLAMVYMSFSTAFHNVLCWIYRFETRPTPSFTAYFNHLQRQWSCESGRYIPAIGYLRLTCSALPACLLGLAFSWFAGEYDPYFRQMIVPWPIFLTAYLVPFFFGGVVITLVDSVVRYSLLRLNVDVLRTYLDEIIVAVLSVLINRYVFLNSVGMTIAISASVFLLTLLTNRLRLAQPR